MHFTHVYKVQRYLVFTSCYLFGLVLYFHVPCSMFHVPRSMFHVPRSIHSPSLSELLACYSSFLARLFCTATGQFSPRRRTSLFNQMKSCKSASLINRASTRLVHTHTHRRCACARRHERAGARRNEDGARRPALHPRDADARSPRARR